MKKATKTILASLLICFVANAQHIPDNDFARAIEYNCSSCIDLGYNLLPAAQSLKKLIVSNYNIASLEGIEGFSSLTELDIHNNTLINSLPKLPVTLTTLDISHTGINNIVSLPPKLDRFFCNYCPLTLLPALPATLSLLSCENTRLTSLPDLPESLIFLYANYSLISSLPKLPGHLMNLEIGGTNITTLPPLPDALTYLTIPGNNIGCYQSNNPGLEVQNVDLQHLNVTFCNGYPKPAVVIVEKKPEQKTETVNKPEQKTESTNKVTLQNSNGQDNGKCISGNCKNGIGVYVTKDGDAVATYKGSFKDGKFDGKGTFTSTVGSYTGEFKNDLMEGMGTLVFKNGKKRTGVWKEGQLWSGTGYFEFGEKESYNGGIKDYKPDGQGVHNYPNGKNFTGSFSKGVAMNGKGYLFNPDNKSSYEGTFVNSNLSGIGIYTNSGGQVLSGNFIDGELNGNGKWVSPDGDKYEGNFKNGNFDGYGVATSKNGRVYKGNWAAGKKNGTGSQYDANGNLEYNGVWNNGERGDQENTVSKEKEMQDNVKKIFSRGVFKGHLNSEDINVKVTDVYYINNDYKLTGTHLETFIYDGDGDGQDDKYSCKMDFTGTYDPVTHKIDVFFTNTIFKDQLPGNLTWKLFGITATIYDLADHPGYFVIKGDDSNEEFQETDYY